MPALIYFLAIMLSYCGLAVGIFLMHFSPEEQKPGRNFFLFLTYALPLIALVLLLFFNLTSPLIASVIVLIGIAALASYRKKNSVYSIFGLFGFILGMSWQNSMLFSLECILFFVLGMSIASLHYMPRKRNIQHIINTTLFFFIPATLLFVF